MVHEKNWRVSLYGQELRHPRDFLNSCSHSGISEYNGSLRSVRSTCELDTSAGWEPIPLRSSRARVSLSLDTVVVGEVDELEEDVGWCWRRTVGGRTRWQTRNHDRNEVLRVALYSNTVFSEMWFLIVHLICKNIRFHRKAFRAVRLAYSRGLS